MEIDGIAQVFLSLQKTFLEIFYEGPTFHTCQDMYFNHVDLLGYTILRESRGTNSYFQITV